MNWIRTGRRRAVPPLNCKPGRWLIIALFLCSPGALLAGGHKNEVNSYMLAQAGINSFSGSILIARKGKVFTKKCYRPEPQASNGECAVAKRYPVGSIAKQFTAVAILQLQEAGKIKLRDSVCKYLADCPSAWNGITILDLLEQTDGVPEENTLSYATEASRPELSVLKDVAPLRDKPLEFAPGTRVKFGNSGYAVLSAVVESVSGEPYFRYLRDHVFTPAGMQRTGPHVKQTWNHPGNWVTPPDLAMAKPYAFAQVYSTVGDLYRWVGAFDSNTLMSKSSIEEMFTARVDGYGFGWVILKQFGREAETQNGGFNLLSSSIRRYPQSRTYIVVLSDATNVDAEKISRDLAAIVFEKHYEMPARRHPIAVDPILYDSYVGTYETRLGLLLAVKKKQDQLFIQVAGHNEVELIPASETRFYVSGLDTEINFVKGMNGQASELILEQGDREIPLLRKS
jgi:CubicO group peptidase (beta-lactamase class C family)